MAEEKEHARSEDHARPREWRCYFCDEVFTDTSDAANHFGHMEDGVSESTACKLTKDEKGIVGLLREAWAELRAYREEDTKMIREVYALGADHSRNAQAEEEKGYARGMRDGALLICADTLAKYQRATFDKTLATLTEYKSRFLVHMCGTPPGFPANQVDIIMQLAKSALEQIISKDMRGIDVSPKK